MTTDQSPLDKAIRVLRLHLRVEYFQGAWIEAETIRLLVDEIDRLRREAALKNLVEQAERLGLEY